MNNKTPDSQIKASRSWEQRNKKEARKASYKRTARLFVRSHATLEDLDELNKLIKARREELES